MGLHRLVSPDMLLPFNIQSVKQKTYESHRENRDCSR
jgi:hypothetical protein